MKLCSGTDLGPISPPSVELSRAYAIAPPLVLRALISLHDYAHRLKVARGAEVERTLQSGICDHNFLTQMAPSVGFHQPLGLVDKIPCVFWWDN